ncbi:hypothetical protein L596_014904 [Steinernema carpocapsae]|uniref:Extracellular membrane protein CFEM domain-containing protein n=1 Tax=Steinernema carpocapsae TaxID=34508 RepID=A0A4U5NDW8_STECR|nr:hypothetical protein L596_014904 [Steinernema carpocapsae]
MRADVVALTMILAVEFSAAQNPHPQTVSVRQCRCKDIDGCSSKIFANVAQCKSNSQCVEFLKKIGDDAKIRTCLDAEQAEVAKMEECVRSKVGTVGCSKEANPGNLTIPLIPVMEAPEMYSSEGEATLAFQPSFCTTFGSERAREMCSRNRIPISAIAAGRRRWSSSRSLEYEARSIKHRNGGSFGALGARRKRAHVAGADVDRISRQPATHEASKEASSPYNNRTVRTANCGGKPADVQWDIMEITVIQIEMQIKLTLSKRPFRTRPVPNVRGSMFDGRGIRPTPPLQTKSHQLCLQTAMCPGASGRGSAERVPRLSEATRRRPSEAL